MTTADRLDGLIGLPHAKSLVLRLATGHSYAHAVLFYGPEGAGKSELAQILAQAWLCTNPGEHGACGDCAACQTALRGAHPDLLLIEPLPPSHIIRLAAVTGGEENLSIQQLFRTPPLSGRNKVVVVRSAERMNADAANAFLKTLEEPPDRAKVILTSGSPGGLLPTILSRCMACACELPSREELTAKFPDADVFTLELAGGAPGRVARLLEAPGTGEGLRGLAQAISALAPRDALAVMERFRHVSEARDSATGIGARRAQADTLAELGVALRLAGCHHALAPVAEAHRRILGNGNATLVLDQLFTTLAAAQRVGN
ncbi:MAG TPA: hypothetical protein VKT78_10625 [Fimbriimonadaceae bacterium]|nr:hypothetical protein [Fimbriimonadaceae bacterium]